MSAVTTARPLFRAVPRQVLRQQQQNFSIMHDLRSFARSFEPHPFQRLPVASRSAPADWGKLVKRSAKQVGVYVPVGFALLGWPYVAATLLDGKV